MTALLYEAAPGAATSGTSATAARHFDGANYAFVDGHVKWFKSPPSDSQVVSNPDGIGNGTVEEVYVNTNYPEILNPIPTALSYTLTATPGGALGNCTSTRPCELKAGYTISATLTTNGTSMDTATDNDRSWFIRINGVADTANVATGAVSSQTSGTPFTSSAAVGTTQVLDVRMAFAGDDTKCYHSKKYYIKVIP